MALREQLTRLFAQFQQLDHQRFIPDNRDKIGTIFVEPLLKTLGYDLGNTLEVERGGENAFLREDLPDYTVSIQAKASIYFEVRTPYEEIRKEDLIDIANATYRGDIGIITNGIVFQVFRLPREETPFQFLFEFNFREPVSEELIEQLSLLKKTAFNDDVPEQLIALSSGETPTTVQPMLKEIKEKTPQKVTSTPSSASTERFKQKSGPVFFTEQQWNKLRTLAWVLTALSSWEAINNIVSFFHYYSKFFLLYTVVYGAVAFFGFKLASTKDLKNEAIKFIPVLLWLIIGLILLPLIRSFAFRMFGHF